MSTFIHTSITEIDMESMPAMGTKINLTACPDPASFMPAPQGGYLDTQADYYTSYYGNCAKFAGLG